jgi:hypothetical protein
MKIYFAMLAFVIIGGAVVYTSFDWGSNDEDQGQAMEETSLKSGGSIKLTEKEATLEPSQGQRKVVLTGLGMF